MKKVEELRKKLERAEAFETLYERVKEERKVKMKWYNIELDKDSALAFKEFLIRNEINYEPSECFNLIHFEVLLDNFNLALVNKWIDENIGD